jgi:hypothetical protein
MTLLHTFTDWIPKKNLTLFTDFISSAKPFGIVRSNNATIGIPTDVYSNENADCLGTVTCTLGIGTSGTVFANRIGIFQSVDTSAAISRAWDIRKGEYEIEARLKTSVSAAADCIMTCGYTLNHNQALESGAYFYHLNLAEFDTGVPVANWQVLRVESTKAATNFLFFVNGQRVWKWVGNDVAERAATGSYAMPCIEIRDRVAGGGARANSFTVDYMKTEERIVR